jgi:hypothetical protein
MGWLAREMAEDDGGNGGEMSGVYNGDFVMMFRFFVIDIPWQECTPLSYGCTFWLLPLYAARSPSLPSHR